MKLSEEAIQDYWSNPSFPAAFAGTATFFKALKKHTKNADLTLKQVKEALHNDATYQMHLNSGRRLKYRRHINATGSGISFECDLFEMPEFEGFKYGLLLR